MSDLQLTRKEFNTWSRETMEIIISYKYKNKDFQTIEIGEAILKEMYDQKLNPIDAATLVIGGYGE